MAKSSGTGGPSEETVLEALKAIEDPDLHKDIVTLGFVKELQIEGDRVSFNIELTTPACPVKDQFKQKAEELVGALEGVGEVDVTMTADTSRRAVEQKNLIPGIKHCVAVASGKGGVGKSTVAANLALALAEEGASVGLLDADIYGPSQPIMFGISDRPNVTADRKLIPLEKYGVKLMSIGFIADERMPVIWRGPLVGKMVQEFLANVQWGDLDYLVVDLPPGTGDAQLTLVQSAPITGAVVVTTPQEVALEDVVRALRMFSKVEVPILGLVENMSFFICDGCGKRHDIFSSGGGMRSSEELGIPFLGEVPLDGSVVEGGDEGVPIVEADPGSDVAKAFTKLARSVAANVSVVSMREETSQSELVQITKDRAGQTDREQAEPTR
ncbi:MAG: Mrp/NBP35 family ATP-binding protein [bacterium]